MENTGDMTSIVTSPIAELMGKLGLPESVAPYATAVVIILAGWLIAYIVSKFIAGAINRTGIGRKAKTTGGNIGKSLSKAAFWIIWLMFILSALSGFKELSGEGKPLAALNDMMNVVFKQLPNVLVALLLGVIGWAVAKVARNTVTSTLEAVQVDRIANRFNVNDEAAGSSNTIAKAVGGLVFGILILLVAQSAFKTAGLTDISKMLEQITGYLPAIFGATAILAIAVIIGRFVAKLAEDILPSLGFDRSLRAIGGLDGDINESSLAPSKIVGIIAFAGITLMGLMAAFQSLNIDKLTDISESLLIFGGKITMGAVIIGVGLFIANFISRIVTQTSGVLAGRIIKYVTIVLVTFMGLSQMEVGDEIVNTAFESFVWAAAFAAGVGGALAFGLGGREWAKGKLGAWFPTKRKAAPKKK